MNKIIKAGRGGRENEPAIPFDELMTVFEQSAEPAHAALSEASFLRCPWPRPVASGTSSQLGAPEGKELDSLLMA
jgi:hypothetical protein